MRESKRKKLDAKGWKIRTAKYFLGMSDEAESYINLRLRLAEGLKTRRQEMRDKEMRDRRCGTDEITTKFRIGSMGVISSV
jgi:hypothetical protein